MIMKILAILSLILVFWCHQSHHHLFMLINTGPFGLASEEFIPANEEALSSSDGPSPVQSNEEVVAGSQSDKKSDDIVSPVNIDNPESSVLKDARESVTTQDAIRSGETVPEFESAPQSVHEGNSPEDAPTKFTQRDVGVKQSSSEVSEEKIYNDIDDSQKVVHASVDDLKTTTGNSESRVLNLSDQQEQSLESDQNQTLPSEVGNGSATSEEPSSPSQKDEEPIPSFMEWTQLQQKKLQESNLGQNGGGSGGQASGQNGQKNSYTTNSQQNKSSQTSGQTIAAKSRTEDNAKNFASPDCGAKVVQSNPESQNANGVLSSSHDEYMLNKCGIPIWFVIELCEPLKIKKVSLGNLELFSSSPKDVEIGISDRYPTREWTKLGPFTLPDIRAIHSITFPATNASTFGKFLKVNILSHYGTEHFCPLSLVRVNGISEYEVLESENTHPEDEDAVEKEEGALHEEPMIDEQRVEGNVADKSVFGSAKDVVINIVKKAAQVLAKSENKDSTQQTRDAAMMSNCRSLLQCLPNYEMPLRNRVLSLLSCNFSNLLPFLSENSPWCGWDYCHALFSKHSIGLPWQPEGFFASVFGGPSVLHALCNYHRPLTKETCDTYSISNTSSSSSEPIPGDGYVNESLRSPPIIVGRIPTEAEDTKKTPQGTESSGNGKQEENEHLSPEVDPTNSGHGHMLEPEQTTQHKSEPSSDSTNDETSSVPAPPVQSPISGNSEEFSLPPTQNNVNNNNIHNNNHNQQQQQASSVQQQQQKESVFVRLSNRIKTLERNQSLTASYLEELSRRFKKQNEENYHINEGTKRFMNESRVKFATLEDLYRFELRSLRRNTDEIRERLFNVQLQRSLLILLCLLQFLGIVSAGIWVRKRFRQFESRLESVAPSSSLGIVSVPQVVAPRHDSPQIMSIRKRLNSELNSGVGLTSIEKSKKIKKKKKKLADLKPATVKMSGPASAPIECIGNKENEFKFEYPVPITSASVFNIPTASFKERMNSVNSEPPSPVSGESKSLVPTTPTYTGASMLSTKVDSPFSLLSPTSTNFLVDSGVSTSSRFALLASPGPGTAPKTTTLKRYGSLTSLDSSSTSGYSARQAPHSIMNGHSDSASQGSGNGKKRKNKGLKALMPKIFDR